MALDLSAEQKTIYDIFSGKEQYIIPPYQRAYSWGDVQCSELLEDLKQAYEEEKETKDGYFLGNIVIAKSTEDKIKLEVIDGQQRLITLTLLIKALFHFDKDNTDLQNALKIKGSRSGDEEKNRLESHIMIGEDSKSLIEAIDFKFDLKKYSNTKKENQFKKNLYYFFNTISEYLEDKQFNLQKFIDFIMNEVSLLPIQTTERVQDKAREKALRIFETINNRGLNLSDSDIFKAKLYAIALNDNFKHQDFLDRWKILDENAQKLEYSVDDIFRFYTHIIRANEEISTTEIGLRKFFNDKEYSPFNKKDENGQLIYKYSQILDDLFKIIYGLEFFITVVKNNLSFGNLTKWFQMIKECGNKYVLSTLIVYLYKNDFRNESNLFYLIEFSKNLVKYAYNEKNNIQFKFGLFELNKDIIKENFYKYIYICKNPKNDRFESMGNMKNGFSLLSIYLVNEQEVIYPYYFMRIFNKKDELKLDNIDVEQNLLYESIANIYVSNENISNKLNFEEKINLCAKSKVLDTKELSSYLSSYTIINIQEREKLLKDRLNDFFGDNNV